MRESGLASLTMRKVAERVGFTETAAYRYFPTKQALVEGLLERLGGIFLGVVRAIASDESLDRRARLERILSRHVELVIRTDGLPVLVLAEAAATGNARLLERMRATVDEYLAVLESLLPEGAPGTEGLRAHDKALLLFGVPAVLAIRRRIGGDPGADEGTPSRLLPFVIRALTGPPDAAPAGTASGGGP